MSLVATQAFVLRSYKLGENDKIAILFTRDFGKVRFVAKGARKVRSRFGAAFEVLTHLRILFHYKENRDLLILDKAEILFSPFEHQTSLRIAYYIFYFSELINEFYPDHEKSQDAFTMLLNIKQALQKHQNLDFLARYIELQLLHSQGILSSVAFCSQCNRPFESLLEKRYLGLQTEIICRRCKTPESVVLSAQIVKSIDSFEKGSAQWAGTLTERTIDELGSLNYLLITRFLGKELQSTKLRKFLV
ncbi:MAG: DNA repair protein RecO [Acidobacteria bacterium]|nr:MAG: DNA repair protein RecO [Acidobacteriota bacterium]